MVLHTQVFKKWGYFYFIGKKYPDIHIATIKRVESNPKRKLIIGRHFIYSKIKNRYGGFIAREIRKHANWRN